MFNEQALNASLNALKLKNIKLEQEIKKLLFKINNLEKDIVKIKNVVINGNRANMQRTKRMMSSMSSQEQPRKFHTQEQQPQTVK